MDDHAEEEWQKIVKWATKIVNAKNEEKKKTNNTVATLKYVALVVIIVLTALALVYIVYRAYTIPEPKTLNQEVNEMIELNQKVYYDKRHQPTIGAGIYT